MKIFLRGSLAAAVLCGVCLAQSTMPAQTNGMASSQQSPARAQSVDTGQASGATRIASGSVIPVQLTRSVDAKKAKTGDKVEAKVTQDLKASNGEVVLPKDTKVVGRVTEAQARNKEQKESQVGIAFDHAVMKSGGDLPMPMSIQAIIAPPPSANANDNAANAESAGQSASAPAAGGMPGNSGGRSTGMGAGMPAQLPSSPTAGDEGTSSTRAAQPITGNTQGVVGISNLKLSTSTDTTQGSVVSSEKNNVKLESGTLMLLRVN